VDHKPSSYNWIASDLTDIQYAAGNGIAKLVWFDIETQEWITAKGVEVVLFKVSNAPKEWEPTFVVDVSISPLEINVLRKLREMGYGFVETEPFPNMRHLHVEGAVVIDVVCEKIELSKSALQPKDAFGES
jgi:hypothetical protein